MLEKLTAGIPLNGKKAIAEAFEKGDLALV
jgi:hypothetical protein